jgi:TPR repeat protein
MLRRQIVLVLSVASVWALCGCHSTPTAGLSPKSKQTAQPYDACTEAVRRYEAGDIPGAEIVRKFEQLVEDGDVRGTMWLARLYSKGRCSLPMRPDLAEQMAKEVLPKVTRLAERNNMEAQFLLGSAYQEGLGVPRDLAKAVAWYTKAVKAGHVTAMNNLGVMLAWGHGTAPDINKARELFSRAGSLGSKLAQKNFTDFSDDGRDYKDLLQALHRNPLVQALGLQKDAAIELLQKNGLLSDPKNVVQSVYKDQQQFNFPADGILFNTDISGRITNVEGHSKGSRNSEQFRGEIPFGLTWDATVNSAMQMLGSPDDQGTVAGDGAYGMAYRIDNVFFSVMFSYEGERKLKLWRVHEKWATK